MAVNIFGEISRGDMSNCLTIPKANNLFVNEAGDQMVGRLDMKNNKIINVAEPDDKKDVATKKYVDNLKREVNLQIPSFLTKNDADNIKKEVEILLRRYIPKVITAYTETFEIGPSIRGSSKTIDVTATGFKQIIPNTNMFINVSLVLQTGSEWRDELFVNIRYYKWTGAGLFISTNTVRVNGFGWGLNVIGQLLILFVEK
jgi:hypothetical protein